MEIRSIALPDRSWVARVVTEYFASPRVVSRGVLRDSTELPGLLAIRDGARSGVALYAMGEDDCEVVILVALVRRAGIGSALLDAVRAIACDAGCRRLWLVTTNDNRPAIDFYTHLGWRLREVHRGAMEEARLLKPEIPLVGHEGVPIRDELEFELDLGD